MLPAADYQIAIYALTIKIETLKEQATGAFDRGYPKHAASILKIVKEYEDVVARFDALYKAQRALEKFNISLTD